MTTKSHTAGTARNQVPSVLDAALLYAKAGMEVFPCYSIKAGRCTCGKADCKSPGKHPRIPNGHLKATTDELQIRRWFKQYPDANIAWRPGEDYCVIDADDGLRKGEMKIGLATLKALEATHGALERSMVAISGGGGLHIICRQPASVKVSDKPAKDIEVKSHSGYIMVEPSNHLSGNRYQWEDNALANLGVFLDLVPDVPVWARAGAANDNAATGERLDISWPIFTSAVMAVRNDFADRKDWIKFGCGIHYQSEGGEEGRALFQAWSALWKEGNDSDDNDTAWNSFKDHPDGKNITGAHVIWRAKKAGWVDPREEPVEDTFEKYHDHYDASYDDTIGYTEKEFRDFFRTGKAKPADDRFDQSYDETVGYTEDEFRDFFRTGKAKSADYPLGGMGAAPAGGTLRFHYDDELEALSDEIDFVQGLLLENSTSTIIGPTGSGKSFFALDIALHLALGIPWHGRKVEKSGVIIAALEGVGGIRKRYKALRQKYDITESLPIAFAEGSFDVRKGKTTRDALIAFTKAAAAKWGVPVRWIVIDTLNRGMAGGKESDSADMGAFREGMDYIRRATGANVCTIHHTGKDESRGGRGSNVLVSDVDTEITTTLHDDEISIARLTKQKDGAKVLLGAFELAVLKLGYLDHWGDEVTSCVLKWVDMPVKGEELSASEQAAYTVLRELAGTPSKGVPEDAFRMACINGRNVSAAKTEKDRGRSFTRSYRSLISKGLVETRDGSVFLIEAGFDDGPDEPEE